MPCEAAEVVAPTLRLLAARNAEDSEVKAVSRSPQVLNRSVDTSRTHGNQHYRVLDGDSSRRRGLHFGISWPRTGNAAAPDAAGIGTDDSPVSDGTPPKEINEKGE